MSEYGERDKEPVVITFVIPVRHQDNAADWPALCHRLSQTMSSIAAQRSASWQGIIVANRGANLPDLPAGFAVREVDFEPNPLHDMKADDKERVYESFRLDKGRRVLAGMLAAAPTRFFMIVDDDDFVSANIADFVAKNPDANGWKIERGWVWGEGGGLVYAHDAFDRFCGTSLIVRSDLYALPRSLESASEEYIKSMLGSHVRIASVLADRGAALSPLPFRGAIYRIGHAGAHSKSKGLLSTYLFRTEMLRRPLHLLRTIRRLRRLNRKIRNEFFGQAARGGPAIG